MLKAIDSGQGNISAVLMTQAARFRPCAKIISPATCGFGGGYLYRSGRTELTVYKPITNEAVVSAQEAVRLAKGEKTRANSTVSNGKGGSAMPAETHYRDQGQYQNNIQDGFQTFKDIDQALSADQRIK